MAHFFAQYAVHWLTSSACTAVGIAALRNLPKPRDGSVWYRWLYNTVQTLLEKPREG